MADGWAVKQVFGEIFVNTISDTSRAAKVNWLAAVAGVMVLNIATDEAIEDVFENHAADYAVQLIEVEIKEQSE